jgi:hypothetical protein
MNMLRVRKWRRMAAPMCVLVSVAVAGGLACAPPAAAGSSAAPAGSSAVCPAGQVESTYVRPSNGQFYNNVFGNIWAAQDFPALGTSIISAATWMFSASNAPTVLSIAPGPGSSLPPGPSSSTVLGSMSTPAGQTGYEQVTFPSPIPVSEGMQYLLYVSSPSSTTGLVDQQIPDPNDLGYADEGGGPLRSAAFSMALEVTFCGPPQPTLTYAPDSSGPAFEAVTGSALAGESFVAGDNAITSASIYLATGNNAPLSVSVHAGSPTGQTLGTVTLPAGPAGQQTVYFPYEVVLKQGSTYVLTVNSAGSAANSAVLAAQPDNADLQGYTGAGAVDTDMAMQVVFGPADPTNPAPFCPAGPENSSAYVTKVDDALASGTDVLGNEAINSPGGPSLKQISSDLAPLKNVGSLTDTGGYYLPFSQPDSTGPTPTPEVALHVADGSEFYSNNTDTPGQNTLRIMVGKDGYERYGLCAANSPQPTLADGYLPVLNTRYTDLQGVQYTEQSFATRIPQVSQLSPGYGNLVSFIKLTVNPSGQSSPVTVKFALGATGLTQDGDRLVSGSNTYLLSSPGGSYSSPALSYIIDPSGGPRTIYLIRLNEPDVTVSQDLHADAATYNSVLSSTENYWKARLKSGATYSVPEKGVTDAELNTEIQQMQLGSYYSYGNGYQTQFFVPDAMDIIATLEEYGNQAEAKAQLERVISIDARPVLADEVNADNIRAVVAYYDLTGDPSLINQYTSLFSQYLNDFTQQINADPHGLLKPEQWTGDFSDTCYATSWEEAFGWAAFNGIIRAWDATGHADLAAQYTSTASSFATSLQAALTASSVTLPDGSIFVPQCLYAGIQPYADTTSGLYGDYYDITIGDLLGTGLLAPNSTLAVGLWKYLSNHGAFFLGEDRFDALTDPNLSGAGLPGYNASGADNDATFGVDTFLAANDNPAQLQMRLYADIGVGMTPGTFVNGEGFTIQPVNGQYYRSMYLPPNSDSVSNFLETLRVMLVNEELTADGTPDGLQLAYSVPAAWLQQRKTITVRNAPTDFGSLSYTINGMSGKGAGTITATVHVPNRNPISHLSIRLNPGTGSAISNVMVNGVRYTKFNAATDTIDLSGLTGTVSIVASYRAAPNGS